MRWVPLATASPLLIGVSEAADGNMALHTGDEPQRVVANRAKIANGWRTAIHWMNQVHSTALAEVTADGRYLPLQASTSDPTSIPTPTLASTSAPIPTSISTPPTVDGLFARASATTLAQRPTLAVLTADCLPVILYSQCGTQYAAVHAGWRGLLNGILLNAVKCFSANALHAYIGPAISQPQYQVPLSFRQEFESKWKQDLSAYFQADGTEHLRADLAGLAQHQLQTAGVDVQQSQLCTAADPCFFSYRHHKTINRLATLVGPPAA
ncbi:polyphenol oxidase family protein [Umboniibacter marinipuniceus]|uniref:Purine nucleoside phosphorylase n=1 Tax=Umboniibacter marinipuniceus TaxID=569599 RepID=A0A3M0A7E1_9GAMM|nr:polyphenol oxidase family protein [Umboniibacter marinipuniceus]RMA78385.1 hypothetical protein DFR27_2316 [Umboniibacter marinipuniceus]